MNEAKGKRPWSRMVAILTACYVTLVGLMSQLDPDVILIRSFIAAAIAGGVTFFVVGVATPSEMN